jgi:TonB family protein
MFSGAGGDGLMNKLVAAAVMTGLLCGSQMLSAKSAKPKGHLGSEWVNGKGDSRHAQMGLYLKSERGVADGIYRPVQFQWPEGDIQKGPYPGSIAADEEGEVRLRVTIGADGKMAACEIVEPSAVEAFNGHACPHLIRYSRFIPALSDQGERLSKSYEAVASYELVPKFYTAAPMVSADNPPVRKASLTAQPTLATAGIDASTVRPKDVSYIAAAIGVGKDGKVTGCTLHSPTEVDALDRQICDALKKNLVIRPAVDLQTNQPVEDSITVSLYWK